MFADLDSATLKQVANRFVWLANIFDRCYSISIWQKHTCAESCVQHLLRHTVP